MTRTAIRNRILSLYGPGSEGAAYSINAIAKRIGAAYPHTHAAVTALLRDGTLAARTVGRAKLCTPNLDDPATRALLNSVHQETRERRPGLQAEIDRLVRHDPRVVAALTDGTAVTLLLTDPEAAKAVLDTTTLLNLTLTPITAYVRELLTKPALLDGAQVLYGYETLLTRLAPHHPQLYANWLVGGRR